MKYKRTIKTCFKRKLISFNGKKSKHCKVLLQETSIERKTPQRTKKKKRKEKIADAQDRLQWILFFFPFLRNAIPSKESVVFAVNQVPRQRFLAKARERSPASKFLLFLYLTFFFFVEKILLSNFGFIFFFIFFLS